MRKKAFTLMEITMAIAIVAALAIVAITFVHSYIQTARTQTYRQNLYILNEALNRFKVQGGDVDALTLGAPIENIIQKLGQTISKEGFTQVVYNPNNKIDPDALVATGERQRYRFFQYEDYIENQPALGAATTKAPYGEQVGYLTRQQTAAATDGAINVVSSTGYWAIRTDTQDTIITASGSYGTDIEGNKCYFWPCAGAADETISGQITEFTCRYQVLPSSIDVRGLFDLENLQVGYCYTLNSIRLEDISTLKTFNCFHCGNLTSIDLSGLTAMEDLSFGSGNITSDIDVSYMPNIWSIIAENCSVNSLTIDKNVNTKLDNLSVGGTYINSTAENLNAFYEMLPVAAGTYSSSLKVGPAPEGTDDTIAEAKGWWIRHE